MRSLSDSFSSPRVAWSDLEGKKNRRKTEVTRFLLREYFVSCVKTVPLPLRIFCILYQDYFPYRREYFVSCTTRVIRIFPWLQKISCTYSSKQISLTAENILNLVARLFPWLQRIFCTLYQDYFPDCREYCVPCSKTISLTAEEYLGPSVLGKCLNSIMLLGIHTFPIFPIALLQSIYTVVKHEQQFAPQKAIRLKNGNQKNIPLVILSKFTFIHTYSR